MTSNEIKPFHVALFLPSLGGGGAERVTLNLARGLIKTGGISVDLVLGRANGSYCKDIPTEVRLIDLRTNRMAFTILPLVRYLNKERPDVMISALDYANVAALIASRFVVPRTRTIVVNHIHFSNKLAQLNVVKRVIMPFLMRRLYRSAHAVVSVSRGAADDLAKHIGVPASHVRVIYNPVVDSHLFEKAHEPVSLSRPMCSTVPTILAVGRLSAQKDLGTLIRAMFLVKQSASAKLMILGEGEQRGELEKLISELGLLDVVDMSGFVDNPYSYMSHAAVLVLSSRWEALPTVLIEAMACGIPIIATDCPSGPREILADGKYGRLVPVGDVAAMAGALLEALQGRVPSPPSASWEPYTVEHATGEYLKIIGNVDRNLVSSGAKQECAD